MKNKSLAVVGPFATEYSLAKINRNLAIALAKYSDFDSYLWADANTSDRLPTSDDYRKYPELKKLFRPTQKHSDIVIFDNFPKDPGGELGLKNLDADTKLAYLAWEESLFPAKWVNEVNDNLHGLLVISEHVARIMRASGVRIPIKTVDLGLHLADVPEHKFELATNKKFRFLHVSSAHPRKGVDVLLRAYFAEFNGDEDVVLVIKLYPNPASVVDEVLASLKKENPPKVLIMRNTDFDDGQMVSLYKQCQVGVFPSRAEGFGLPIAEAMQFGLPVITTGYSGQMDFCNSENSYLLDYKLTDSIASQNYQLGSKWAEPDQQGLQLEMRHLYENYNNEEVKEKIEKAKIATRHLTWENTAKQVAGFCQTIDNIHLLKSKRLAVISTINTKCGIADTSCRFYPNFQESFEDFIYLANTDAGDRIAPDDKYVLRTWEYGEENFVQTLAAIDKFSPDVVHVQYNSPFYSLAALSLLLAQLTKRKITAYLTIHSIETSNSDFGNFRDDLAGFKRIFIQSHQDLEFLQKKGYSNTEFSILPTTQFVDEDKSRLRAHFKITNQPILATHGLIHDGKGIIESIKAIALLKKKYPEILLLCINAVNPNNSTSSATYAEMRKTVRSLNLEQNVYFFPEFLELPEIRKLLHLADIILLPYANINESASGAVRTCMASGRAVIITDTKIFSELPVGFKIKNNKPETISGGVEELLGDNELYKKQIEQIKKYLHKYSWEQMSEIFLEKIASDLS
jgi:glycosyltransferase involved in cell wall biosynthesis